MAERVGERATRHVGPVVIVGGGFAGFWAAAAARRTAGSALDITLVSPSPSLVMRPRLYEADPERLSVDLPPLLAALDVELRLDAATSIDPTARTVSLGSGAAVAYGRLVVATGSVMGRPPVPGAGEAHSIDSQAEAVELDRRLAAIAAHVAAPVIAVVGAGFTGIELALELRDRVVVHGGAALGERLRIVLIDRAAVVGAELGPGPRPVIEAALREARVELRLGANVTALSATTVDIEGAPRLDADAVVLATGLRAAPFTAELPGDRDELGRILVDPYLRAPAAPTVFVAGDAAAADTGDGHRTLASCQHALQLGRYAGENAARDLLGRPLVAYEQLRYVTCLDLGRAGAVLTKDWDRTIALTGAEAKARKVAINTELIYPPASADAEDLLRQSALDPAART